MTAPAPLTLSQFARRVKDTLAGERGIFRQWVTAELSDLHDRSGHCYAELVEKGPNGESLAKMRATIWASTYRDLKQKFFSATGRPLASGLKVMLLGSASFHEIYGLAFNVHDIDPSYTMGDLERVRREILEALTREGIINRNKELPFPIAPQRIAIISAAGAAGYGDFLSQLDDNGDGIVFYHTLYQAVMQGTSTAPSVLDALDRIEMAIDLWDCVVIIRGGGATTDLIGFDNLELARRIATFSIPVIVGIGHERDRTVLDEIAALRVKTPTAAAEALLTRCREAWQRARVCCEQIVSLSRAHIEGCRNQLDQYLGMIPALAGARIEAARSRLDGLASTIPTVASSRISSARADLSRIGAAIPMAAAGRLAASRSSLDAMAANMRLAILQATRREEDRLKSLEQLIGVLSPEATLKRGYSLTKVNGRTLRSAKDVAPGDTITTLLPDGTITSKTL